MAAARVESNGITLAYETFGDRRRPPLVLVAGLGVQMIRWHEDLCALLAERHYVVRFDNRDSGESTHIAARMPNLRACMAGDASSAPYSLDDMGDDTAGLLDALGLASAHLVGASMGGMICQVVAIRHPRRVRSLTSIMSTTGERAVSEPTPEATSALLHPAARNRDDAMRWAVEVARVIGSPGFARDEAWIRELAGRSWDRAHDPAGFGRQLGAIYASGDRTLQLGRISAPTLVVHGEDDPLIPLGGGLATAAAIPGAELWTIPGMGHDLPRPIWRELVERITSLTGGADRDEAA